MRQSAQEGINIFSIKSAAGVLKNSVLDMLYPEGISCIHCGVDLDTLRSHDYDLCDKCLSQMGWITGRTCTGCGGPIPLISETSICPSCSISGSQFHECFSCFIYDGTGKQMILDYKFGRKTYLGSYLADMLADRIQSQQHYEIDLIVSVPLHRARYLERGFDQMKIIGERLSERLGKPYSHRAITRIVNTPRLKTLNRDERKSLMEEVFEVSPDLVYGKRVLLIDDIHTTGSTIRACTRRLLNAGALGVSGGLVSVNIRD